MSNVSLNLYRIFCIVAQSKSYSEASKKLNITTSTISSSIKKLESILGLKLFNRSNDGITLTKMGKELFELIVEEIETIDFAEKTILDKTELKNGEITIGCQSHIATYYLMECIEKAQKDYPKLKINIIGNMNSDEMLDVLRNHKVDFTIMHIKPRETDKKIKIKELKVVKNIFVSNKPIKINKIQDLNNYKYILNSDYTKTAKELNKILEKHEIQLKPSITSDITELRVDGVKRGLGIAYVMEDSVKKELKNKELYEVKVPIELPTFNVKLGYIKGQLTKVSKSFINQYLKI